MLPKFCNFKICKRRQLACVMKIATINDDVARQLARLLRIHRQLVRGLTLFAFVHGGFGAPAARRADG